MSLPSGTYLICSLANDYSIARPTHEDKSLLPKPIMSLKSPNVDELHPWVFEQCSESGTYRIKAGGTPTGVKDGLVFAMLGMEDDKPSDWKVELRPQMGENCYTIENVDGCGGWSLPNTEKEVQVAVEPIVTTRSLPPLYMHHQVFIITPAPEE